MKMILMLGSCLVALGVAGCSNTAVATSDWGSAVKTDTKNNWETVKQTSKDAWAKTKEAAKDTKAKVKESL